MIAIIAALGLGMVGWAIGRNVQVGDLNQGAPELRQSSLYNRDNAYILSHYATGSDTFVVMADTKPTTCVGLDVILSLIHI